MIFSLEFGFDKQNFFFITMKTNGVDRHIPTMILLYANPFWILSFLNHIVSMRHLENMVQYQYNWCPIFNYQKIT